MQKIAYYSAIVSLILLAMLCLAWEIWLAPLRSGGSWLALKALLAILPLRNLLHGRRYTFQWSSMLILFFLLEGITRAWSEPWPQKNYALLESVLAAVFFVSAVVYARQSK